MGAIDGGTKLNHNIIGAIALSIGLIVAAFLYGGRYYFIRLDECTIARGDRWTGKVQAIPTVHTTDCEFQELAR